MEPLVRGFVAVRTFARRGHGLLAALGLGAYVVFGGATAEFGVEQGAALGIWALLLASRVRRKLRETSDAGLLLDVEVGSLLAVALEAALVRLDGGLSGRLSPALYVLVALVAAFARPLAGVFVVGWILALETGLRLTAPGPSELGGFATHAVFVATFALLNLTLLRAEVARIRVTARARVEAQLVRIREDARSYRLLGAGEAADREEVRTDRLARASVEEIHQSVHYALDLLRRSLDLHTAVLLWLNDAGTHLRISELSTSSNEVQDAPFASGDGVLGAVLAKRVPVSLHGLKPSFRVPYYPGPCPVRALAAVPVLDGETLRGVLAIDRLDGAFTPEEEEMGAQAARFCLRAIQNERVFLQLERAKVEQGKLYRAAQALGSALSEKDVVEAGVKAAREIASFDLAAVTVYDESTRTHEIVAAKCADGKIDDLVGVRFAHNTGLVSMVVQNRCPLPYRGEYEAGHKTVLSKRLPWPAHPSLLVLPLVLHERALGTLILGAKRRHAFGDPVRPTLEVLASHLAVSLSNARMVQKLETMATTDGLTGLFNKRAMLESAAQKIAASARFDRKLAVLMTDIDHFKKVNDTYGHDVGDVVIRGLADILKRQKRTTDIVARFGGEEFVALCEQTDEKGAMLLAERIREELGKTIFRTSQGALSVTCSIGVAIFPDAGRDWEALFKAADEALYVSKRSGRNRCTAWRAPSSRPASRKAASGT
ncbi:MAG TPA: sensor domain-containing diguanylate cyclase [Polyangiaceae bacterium]|jgi:two-component system cell cycle response regulator|nr:sensor domain-containing diguanylate cyclase [Polyangiaceae bacterium]